MERRINILGSPVLGVFATCTDEIVFLPAETDSRTVKIFEESLGVAPLQITLEGSSIIGSLMGGNNNGVIVSRYVLKKELTKIRKYMSVAHLPGEMNAAGNIILSNDNGALVHPDLSDKAVEIIGKTLKVDVHRGTIGGLKTVGMCAVATNKGMLVHPKATGDEIEQLEKWFGVYVDIGTVNFGSPLVGSALVANSKGYVVGKDTTGPELSRIEDALGFI